jgi:hypothetical protein
VTTPPVQVSPTQPVPGGNPITGGRGSTGSGSIPTIGGSPGSPSNGSPGSSTGTANSGSSFGSPAAVAAAAASGAPRGHATRWWIAVRGADKRKQATLVFKLGRRGIVRVTIVQVAPVCRVAAKFRVGGHAGTNRVTIGGGAHGAQLTPGTYRIVGRTRDGRAVLRQTLVVVDAGAPSPAELTQARRSNVCAAGGVLGASTMRGSLASATLAGPGGPFSSTINRHQRQSGESGNSGTSGTSDEGGGRPIAAGLSEAVKQATNPFVIALLGLAVLIFGVAALPRTVVTDPRMMTAVASHRAELALAGGGILAVAIIAMLAG